MAKKEKKALLVRCDSCTFTFIIAHRTRSIPGGQLHYFACPKCDKEYAYGVSNAETIAACDEYTRKRKEFLMGKLSLIEVEQYRVKSKAVSNAALNTYLESQKSL